MLFNREQWILYQKGFNLFKDIQSGDSSPRKLFFSFWHWPCSVCEYWAKWRKHTNKDPFQSCKSHRRTLIKSSTTNPGPMEVPLWLLLMSLPTQWDLHSRRMEAVCSPRGIDIFRNWTEDICGVLEVTRAIWFYWGWLLRIRFCCNCDKLFHVVMLF